MQERREEVSDLVLEKAAATGDLEVLRRVSVARLKAFKHSRGQGRSLLQPALKGQQAEVVKWLVRVSTESGVDLAEGWTLGHAASFAGDLATLRELGEDELQARSDSGNTLVHASAYGGHVEAIDVLVELGVDPKVTRNDGCTTIHTAALHGHVAAIDRLVGLGVDPKAVHNDGYTTIHSAAQNGHVAAIDRLVELGVDSKAEMNDGWTAIHLAALHGHVAAIERLVALGVDPKAEINNGWTTIHAAAQNGHVVAIERLVALGADPKATRNDGLTTIHSAASNGHVAAIDRLVDLGVDAKAVDNDDCTAIHSAAQYGHVAAIERLVALGVDPKATTYDSSTSIHSAALSGHVVAIERLVALGVDPKATTYNGWTAIHAAAQYGHVAAIDRLVELGVDPKATTDDSRTTIHAAAANGHVAAIERLVSLGVDPKAVTFSDWSPLHIAAQCGRTATAALLLHLGASAASRTSYGKTPLDIARAQPHAETASLLVDPSGWLVCDSGGSAEFHQGDELPVVAMPPTVLVNVGPMKEARLQNLMRFSASFRSLEVLGLHGLDAAGAAFLASVLSSCSQLRRLDLPGDELGGTAFGDDGLHAVLGQLAGLPGLQSVSLQHNRISDASVVAALRALMPRVRRVDLRNNIVEHERVAAVVDALALGGVCGAVKASWAFLRSKEEVLLHQADAAVLRCASAYDVRLRGDLARLNLGLVASTKAGLGDALAFLRLVEAEVKLSLPYVNLSETQQLALAQATQVKSVDLETDTDWVALLANGKGLVQVNQFGCSLSHGEAAALAALPSLSTLDLSSSTFDNLDWLRPCASLTSLSLARCTLSSSDLEVVASLPRLQRLVVTEAAIGSLSSLVAGCPELRFLDVRGCNLSKAPTYLASLPALRQLVVIGNPFVAELQEYGELLADPVAAVEFVRTLALSSEGKTRDVPVVMVGHGRAGKSQVLRALLYKRTWLGMLPGVVERVPLVTERTSVVEAGVRSLHMSAQRLDSSGRRVTDEFEVRFFDTPGQMEFFASNMTVLAPLFSSCVVVCVVRCVRHGAALSSVSLAHEKVRIEREFRLWLAEVSRAVLGAHQAEQFVDEAERRNVPPTKRASVLLVVTHRDVLEHARGKHAVAEAEAWLQDLVEQLRVEFEASLDVHRGALLVNASVAGACGHGVVVVREQLESLVHSRFVHGPTLPEVLVAARAFVVSEEVRRRRVLERATLEELVSAEFGERGLTLRLLRRLLEVLETNGSVLRTPARRLVVVDPGWISAVMSSLYVDPKKRDAEHEMGVEASDFDALAAFDEGGEVVASALLAHLGQFVDGDDALLERLLLALVSNGIAVPLRVSQSASGARKTESYMIVGRWMTGEDEDDSGGVRWSSGRESEASWFELVTGRVWLGEAAGRMLALTPGAGLLNEPPFRLVSLRCSSGVRMGPSFLTWLMYEVSSKLAARRYSFTVRRSGFACVLPFTRFQAAVHVQLPASGREFDVTLLAKRGDAAAALSFVVLEVVFPVLEKLSLQSDMHVRVVQRCSGCVGTHEHLESDELHDRELASGGEVVATVESVQALCDEVCEGANYRPDSCRGCEGVLSRIMPENDGKAAAAPRHDFASSFVPTIDRASIKLDKKPRVLGSGQFGSVMEGLYNGARVVLKELKVTSSEALAAFEEEAELLGRACKHPCISLLLGLCRMGVSQVYLVMERAGVCDLEKALCEPAVKPLLGKEWSEFGVVAGLLADVASALQHMHSQDPPIVHNDVALRNVLVRHENGQNRAKLTDMGLACAVARGSVKQLAPGTSVPMWQMAPETLASREVSPASDVFQFGNLVYEVLARRRPFWDEWKPPVSDRKELKVARAAVVKDIKQGRRPSWEAVKVVGAFCPSWLRELADKCCSPDAADRPTMLWVGEQLAGRVQEMQGVPRKQEPLGVYEPADEEEEVQKAGHVRAGSEGSEQAEAMPAADDNDDDEDDEAKQAEVDDGDEPAPAPAPASTPAWSVDDVCAWLLQLGIPACIELVPLFRHYGVDGALLLELDCPKLEQLDIPWLTARALLKARDALQS